MLIQIKDAAKPGSEKKPDSPEIHLFRTESGWHVLLVNGSRIYSIPDELADALRSGSLPAAEMIEAYGLAVPPYIDDVPLFRPSLRAISLAIAQTCNLSCVYCYAQQGSFGGKPQPMEREVAFRAIDLLLDNVKRHDKVQIIFLGGEPLANRGLLRDCTEYAVAMAAAREVSPGFAITTNGTLVTLEDRDFFEQYGFTVTVSLDGTATQHDRLRPFADGRGSYERIIARVKPLLKGQHRMQVSARVTVTPANLDLLETLDELLALGFHSVGFSPMLSSPSGEQEMDAESLDAMLDGMIRCGLAFERHLYRHEPYPFLNLTNALREIHKGTHRPYPCGAGAGYVGVSANGGLYACHRFVGDATAGLGGVTNGIDTAKQDQWLATRHVHNQEPCRSCWAKYLCGGGCHHEVIRRGRPACNYIRGWLDYCLQAYIRILEKRPHYFTA